MPSRTFLLAAAALAASALVAVDAAPKVTHFLQLSVEGDDSYDAAVKTIADLENVQAYVKKEKLGENILMLIRSALQKVGKGVQDAKQQRALSEQRKAAKAKKDAELAELRAKEAPFTSGDVVVRPLKKSMHAPSCNVKRYSDAGKLMAALREGKVDLGAPFLVGNMASKDNAAAKEFREGWTAEALKAMKDIGIQYLTPRLAKLVMEGGRDSGQTMEVFQPELINFATYFSYCFGKSKTPGTETEHCEQTVPALALAELGRGKHAEGGQNATALLDALVGPIIGGQTPAEKDGRGSAQLAQLGALRRYEASLSESVENLKQATSSSSSSPSWIEAGDKVAASITSTKQTIRTVHLGPAASGKQLWSNRHSIPNPQMGQPPKTLASSSSFVDVLVFGQRRWLMFTDAKLKKLRAKAGADFQPTTAYQFFESQYAELKEEYGLELDGKDGKKGGAWECNQRTGDALYVPSDLHFTSLALDDGLSYRQQVATRGDDSSSSSGGGGGGEDDAFHKQITRSVYDPTANKWAPAICYLAGADAGKKEATDAMARDLPFWDELAEAQAAQSGQAVAAEAMPGMIAQALGQQLGQGGPALANQQIFSTLAECRAVFALHPSVPATATVCGSVWDQCTAAFASNVKASGVDRSSLDGLEWIEAGVPAKLMESAPPPASAAKDKKAAASTKKKASSKKTKKKSKKKKKKKGKKDEL